jgi:DNA-binding MarR family transcriptional regulator
MPSVSTDAELRAWKSFIRTHRLLFKRLDSELDEEHRLSLPEYEVLLFLHESPEGGLRMGDLARLSLLSPSGVTRLVERLEGRGLVERCAATGDARAVMARLTPAGAERWRDAGRTHLRGIREHFLSRLDADERDRLTALLEKVAGESPADPFAELRGRD